MKKFLNAIMVTAFVLSANLLLGQKTLVYQNPIAEYQTGLDLFSKEKYNPALESFNKIIAAVDDVQSELRINAEYYSAICAYELYHKDAESELLKFIGSHPENARVKIAEFYLGKLQYRLKKYSDGLKTLEKVDPNDLSSDQLSEYYFKLGYCYFMEKDLDKASKQFYEIKDVDSKYAGPANYYYAYINYSQKNYETALKSFIKLEGDKDFGSIVPYYIAQIYYLQSNYEEVIKYAKPLLDSATTSRRDEIARILGESYFKSGQYANSIQYLEKYKSKTKSLITREDYYELGYAYYKSGFDYPGAIENLSEVITTQDSLTQNADFILADCYLKSDNKKFAMNSFMAAYKLSFYPDIKEQSLFNYSKLAYELALNPYNEAITSLQKYIKDYPNSANIDEANEYLVDIFLTTKNYKNALASLGKIKNRSEKLNKAFQKIAYYRAIELFNNKDLDHAIGMFDTSNTQPIDNTIKAECYYWKGEAYYRLSEFDSAKTYYDAFLLLPGAFGLPEYKTANYNIGYCYFKQKDYKEAKISFRKFTKDNTTSSAKVLTDAFLRTADCYFISKEYSNAIEYYDKAIKANSLDPDYAHFQKGLCLGAQGKYQQKINTLEDLLRLYPKTAYADDAIYELAGTYLLQEDNVNAMKYYNQIITDYPTKLYAQKAMLKIGWIYHNTDKNQLAVEAFKKVVSNYPASDASQDALLSIKNIYVEMDSVAAFYAWIAQNKIEYGGSKSEEDSTIYAAAENQYMKGLCDNAVKGFRSYIAQFPDGFFITNAYYYKADCDYKKDSLEQALAGYVYVAGKPDNKFSEYAIINAAEICYKFKRYDSAAVYYTRLESMADYKSNILDARTMIMRCYWKTGNNTKAIEAARAVINTDKVTNDLLIEAYMTIGRAGLAIDSNALAQTEFELVYKLSPSSDNGAEALYDLALIDYKLKDYTSSETRINELLKVVADNNYWYAKSFILLADVYVGIKNVPQAKATLQSIIDYCAFPDLVTLAHTKLNAITADEKAKELQKAQEDIEINLNDNQENNILIEDPTKKKEDNK